MPGWDGSLASASLSWGRLHGGGHSDVTRGPVSWRGDSPSLPGGPECRAWAWVLRPFTGGGGVSMWVGCSRVGRGTVDYFLFCVPLVNISLIWGRCQCGAARFGLCLALGAFDPGGSLSCRTCCGAGPRFFRSRPGGRPVRSTLAAGGGFRGPILTRMSMGC